MNYFKMTLLFALEAASKLLRWLETDRTCNKIEIAGSVRRLKPMPGDIELVVEPAYQYPQATFLSETADRGINLFDAHLDTLLTQGVLEKRYDTKGHPRWGARAKLAVFFYENKPVKVDIFSVIEPAEWGAIFAIRTGPGAFNKRLVQHAHTIGRKVAGGQVWDLSALEDGLRWKLSKLPTKRFLQQAENLNLQNILVPTETAYFNTLGIPCWPPQERTENKLQGFLAENGQLTRYMGL